MDDILINFGGSVKALGGGKIGGYLVTFGTEKTPDLSQYADFFEPTTDYDMEDGAKTTMYFHHGLDETLGVRKLGRVEVKADDVGIWAEGVLATRDAYEREIYKLVEAGKLSWSSGATTHLVRREKVEGKNAHRVLHWPISEASLTPNPADYRNTVVAIKSAAFDTHAYDHLVEGKDGSAEVKTGVLGDMTPDLLFAAFDRLSSKLGSFVYQKIWQDGWGDYCASETDAPDDDGAQPIDRNAIADALEQYSTTVLAVLDALLALPKPDAMATKSFLAQFDRRGDRDVVTQLSALPIKSYLDAMGSVVSDCDRRLTWYAEQRQVKSGRVISTENITAIQKIRDGMKQTHKAMATHIASLDAMLDKHSGKSAQTPTPLSAHSAYMDYLYMQSHGGTLTL